ncbi:MAG: F-box protein, partial [bacterium]
YNIYKLKMIQNLPIEMINEIIKYCNYESIKNLSKIAHYFRDNIKNDIYYISINTIKNADSKLMNFQRRRRHIGHNRLQRS